MTAEADAEREAKVGIGKAIATQEQVDAYGGPQFQLAQEVTRQLASAIENGHIPLVPQTQLIMGGGSSDADGGGGGGNVLTSLLSVLLTEKLTGKPVVARESDRGDDRSGMEAHRRAMKESVMRSVTGESPGPNTGAEPPKAAGS